MGHNYAERKPMYVEENPDLEIYPLNCVPSTRPKGSWTNGIKAYTKGTNSESSKCVGWFFPPRIRNRGHHTRKGPKRIMQRTFKNEEEE